MDNIIDKIDALVVSDSEQYRINKLREVYKDVTHVQALSSFYRGCEISKIALQLTSILLGIGFAMSIADKMPSIEILAFILGIAGLICLEYSKGYVVKEIAKTRIINRAKAIPIPMGRYYFAALTLTIANVCVGFWGSPYIVDGLVECKGLENIASIDSIFEAKRIEQTEYFTRAKKDFESQAYEVYKANLKQDSTLHTSGRKHHADLKSKAATQTDSLTSSLSFIKYEHSLKVKLAEAKNNITLGKHQNWCNGFSWIAAIIATIIEFWLIVLAFWCADFDKQRLIDADSREKLLAESKELQGDLLKQSERISLESKIKDEKIKEKDEKDEILDENKNIKDVKTPKQKAKSNDNELVMPMGFHKEGDVIKSKRKNGNRVVVEVGGVLSARTIGQMRTLIDGQVTSDRIKHLEKIKNKLL